MTRPTRLQIEGIISLPLFKVEIHHPTIDAWIELSSDSLVSFTFSIDSATGIGNGVAFGAPVNQQASIAVEDYTAFYGGLLLSDVTWLLCSCRISIALDTSEYVQLFLGVITGLDKSGYSLSIRVDGILARLNETKITSPMFIRKRGATKTTSSSVEDPTNINYVGGLINYGLWFAGGRPYEQKDINYFESDTDWKFWYSSENSIIAPEYSWYSGDNVIDEVYRIARAIGGQIYQTVEGVIRYVEPLGLGDNAAYAGIYYTITDDDFVSYQEAATNEQKVLTLKMTYTPRFIEPEQVIIEDKTPRLFAANETKTIDLEPQLPIYTYSGVISGDDVTATNTMVASYFDNTTVTPTIGTVTMHAAKLSIEITNPSATQPMILHSIKVKGRPLQAQADLQTAYGTLPPEKIIENSVYIQNDADAERYLRMLYDFYSQAVPTITLQGFQLDTDRYVGELVKLNSIYKNGGTDLHRIIGISYNIPTSTMDIKIVNTQALPYRSQMYIIGDTYSNGDTRKVSY
jgi:hypothetical protein